MPDSVALGETPLPNDYKVTVTEQVQGLLSNGKTIPNCDKDKAMKALGASQKEHEGNRLGSDMIAWCIILRLFYSG